MNAITPSHYLWFHVFPARSLIPVTVTRGAVTAVPNALKVKSVRIVPSTLLRLEQLDMCLTLPSWSKYDKWIELPRACKRETKGKEWCPIPAFTCCLDTAYLDASWFFHFGGRQTDDVSLHVLETKTSHRWFTFSRSLVTRYLILESQRQLYFFPK